MKTLEEVFEFIRHVTECAEIENQATTKQAEEAIAFIKMHINEQEAKAYDLGRSDEAYERTGH